MLFSSFRPGWRPGRGAPHALTLALLLSAVPLTGAAPIRSAAPPGSGLSAPAVRHVPPFSASPARFDADPLVFSLSCSKNYVAVGEEVELTVTVRYVHFSPTVRFLSEGSTGYALKLLLPDGFEAFSNPLRDFARGRLSPARPEASFVVRGRFVRPPKEATFRLLRGPHDADEASLFAEKARLTLQVDGMERKTGNLRLAGGTRQLIFNTWDTTPDVLHFAHAHHFTAVGLSMHWYALNPKPGVYRWDDLRACLNLCRQLGLKLQLNVTLRRQRNTGGYAQDHEPFFPESDMMRYNDGSVCRYQPVADKFDVVPSFSSSKGMASVETFMRELGSFLKAYHDDGTLLNVLAVTGQDGEFNYPMDTTPGNVRWTDYSQPTLQEYRTTYLPGRYGTVAALNQAWGSYLASFADVPYPFGPSPTDQYPDTNPESHRDWIRFGIQKIAETGRRCRTALQSAAPIPFSYFASEMTDYFYSVGFRASLIPHMAATLDGLYTSAGTAGAQLEASKLAWVDVVKATLGNDKIMEIEFDNDDLSSQPNSFDQAANVKTLGSRFFEKGGDYVHITQLGSFNWGAVDAHLKYLRDTYCTAPNNTVTPRAPQASGSYNWTKTFVYNPEGPFEVWRSLGGPSRQVDLRCVDDFGVGTAAPVPAPTPVPPAEVPCTRPAALVADSPIGFSGELQLTASFNGGTAEADVTYRWTRPDGSSATGQAYSFGSLATAPKGTYSFKATHGTGAACLRVALTADGISILD